MKVVLFLILTLFASGATFAASFDCTRATSKMEKAICASPELSRMDEALDASYKAAKERLSAQASGILTKGQVSWLRFTSNYCFVDYNASFVSAAEANKCLVDAFRIRTKELDATGQVIAGYKSFIVINDSIKVARTKEFIYTIQQTYPQFDGISEQAIKLNIFLANIEVMGEGDWRGSESYSVTLSAPSRDWLVRHLLTDSMTGAHPNTFVTCSIYSLSLDRAVRVGDVFTSSAWQHIAKDIVIEHFKALARKEKDFQTEMVFGYEQFELSPNKDFPFCITAKGMFVDGFLPHVVRALDGVTINWDKLNDAMTPYARQQIKEMTGR